MLKVTEVIVSWEPSLLDLLKSFFLRGLLKIVPSLLPLIRKRSVRGLVFGLLLWSVRGLVRGLLVGRRLVLWSVRGLVRGLQVCSLLRILGLVTSLLKLLLRALVQRRVPPVFALIKALVP